MTNEKDTLNWDYSTDSNTEKAFMSAVRSERKCIPSFIRAVSENINMPVIPLFRIIQLQQAYFPTTNTFCSAEDCYYRVIHNQRNDKIDSRNNKHQKVSGGGGGMP